MGIDFILGAYRYENDDSERLNILKFYIWLVLNSGKEAWKLSMVQ